MGKSIQVHFRYVAFLLIFVLILGGGYLSFKHNQTSFSPQDKRALWQDYRTKTMSVDSRTMRLVIADTPAQWSQGLMYVRKPVRGFDGMVFMFPGKAEKKVFWNKNTYIDLTVYWMRDGEVIGKNFLPSIEKSKELVIIESPGPTDTVVEYIQ